MIEYYIKSKLGNINVLEGNDIPNMKAIILYIHGVGSHFQYIYDCIDYIYYREKLFGKFGFKTFAFEFHSHGKSDGDTRCYIKNFDDMLDDLNNMIKYINNKYPETKIFLCGESMGGAVVIKYIIDRKLMCEQYNISGVILLSPLCGIDEELKPSPIMTKILLTMSQLFPKLKMAITTKDLSKKSVYNSDFLKARKICKYNYQDSHRLATVRELYKITLWIPENAHKIDIPIIFFHGEQDTVTTPNGSIDIYNKINIQDKEIVIIDDADHSLLVPKNDSDMIPNFVLMNILKWLENHST
jgi:alpha-beta hydrolase superfamily lysophospholipase